MSDVTRITPTHTMAEATATKEIPAASTASPNKPVFRYRSGGVSASVFARQVSTKDGTVFDRHSVTIQRSYKDKATGDWKHTSNFGKEDLFDVIVAAQKAYEFIQERK